MRHMSFALTTEQIRNQTKTVTRRVGWEFLKVGDSVQAVEKAQGLKKGEKVTRLCVLDVTGVRRERLPAITDSDVVREGFPEMNAADFIELFCRVNRCQPDAVVTRIEFRYVKAPSC